MFTCEFDAYATATAVFGDCAIMNSLSSFHWLATSESSESSIKIATTGGLLRPGSPLLTALRLNLAADSPRARLSESGSPVDSPVGALRLAVQLI